VRDVGGQKKDFALFYRNVSGLAVFDNAKINIALDLIKELLSGIDMVISAAVGTAHYHDDEFPVFPDQLVSDRRLELAAILFDPRFKI
jgi:hypothetical protein